MHVFPEAFDRRLKELFPDFVEGRYNTAVGRFEFVFNSAANRPVSQFWGWDRNSITGAKIEPDPVTGLLPFRDLDPAAQQEIIDSCTRTFIGNRADGDGTWQQKATKARQYNADKRTTSATQRGKEFAYLIRQVDIRRPGWKKDHPRSTKKEYFTT